MREWRRSCALEHFVTRPHNLLDCFSTVFVWLWHTQLFPARALISAGLRSWWNAWTNYSGFTLQQGDTAVVRQREESELQPPRPPAIDNNSLVLYQGAQEKKLKPGLVEGTHYKLVFESTWKLLHQWYDGEPAFVRQWVGGTQPFVEVYALQLTIRRSSDSKEGQLFITREVGQQNNLQLCNAIATCSSMLCYVH